MHHVYEQQKPLETRGRPHSPNQPDSQDLLPTLYAPQCLVRYFDERGGFYRVGRLLSSHTVTRGRRKGQIVLTIISALNHLLTRSKDEVEIVK
jgi:hypothetical protein